MINAAITYCPLCGEEIGVALLRMKPGHEHESPPTSCPHDAPCDECVERMKLGIVLVSGKMDQVGITRTGYYIVMKEEAFDRLFSDFHQYEDIKRKRFAVVEDQLFEDMGLKRLADTSMAEQN